MIPEIFSAGRSGIPVFYRILLIRPASGASVFVARCTVLLAALRAFLETFRTDDVRFFITYVVSPLRIKTGFTREVVELFQNRVVGKGKLP